MGREVRMVPKDWQHPKDATGEFIPLLGGDYRARADEWCEQLRWWMDGDTHKIEYFDECNAKKPINSMERYIEFAGHPPQQKYYMPLWLNAPADHMMMYEDTSEGTPISPAMPTAEALADWLFENEASAFGGATASRDAWLSMIRRGFSVGLVIRGEVMESGVAFSRRIDEEKA